MYLGVTTIDCMNFTIIIAILVILGYILPKLVKFGKPAPSKPKGEWHYRVKFAKLNKELYEKATEEERMELLYYFVQKIRQSDDYGITSLQEMPEPLKTFYFIDCLEKEVNNGGFLQFFTNSTGRYTEGTIESLDKIGASFNKSLLLSAVKILEKHNVSPESLGNLLDNHELHEIFPIGELYQNKDLVNDMHELDKQFYKSEEYLWKLSLTYFEENSQDFWPKLEEKYGN
ncbi:DUF4375 domain-containing protein [Allomuricauda sp. M10]|uniref:DMP19 family protein n=1 Tax=Allomuricauda sp. M10 TaxID=2683292 RepID=UPI001D17ED35|nr:DUF4375 domain-containing protein [Muricauda sp. M10]